MTEQDILYLAKYNKTKNSGRTEAEIMDNIIRDPILIGVTRLVSHMKKPLNFENPILKKTLNFENSNS